MMAPNHFRDFANDAEVPLASCRAKMCAVHTLMEGKHDPSDEVLDAVRHLVAETWASLEQLNEMHGAAFDAARGARA